MLNIADEQIYFITSLVLKCKLILSNLMFFNLLMHLNYTFCLIESDKMIAGVSMDNLAI